MRILGDALNDVGETLSSPHHVRQALHVRWDHNLGPGEDGKRCRHGGTNSEGVHEPGFEFSVAGDDAALAEGLLLHYTGSNEGHCLGVPDVGPRYRRKMCFADVPEEQGLQRSTRQTRSAIDRRQYARKTFEGEQDDTHTEDWDRITKNAGIAHNLVERLESVVPRLAWMDRFMAGVHRMINGADGLEDFQLFVGNYISSVDKTTSETRESLPAEEQEGEAMKEFEAVYKGRLPRPLELMTQRGTLKSFSETWRKKWNAINDNTARLKLVGSGCEGDVNDASVGEADGEGEDGRDRPAAGSREGKCASRANPPYTSGTDARTAGLNTIRSATCSPLSQKMRLWPGEKSAFAYRARATQSAGRGKNLRNQPETAPHQIAGRKRERQAFPDRPPAPPWKSKGARILLRTR
ncbi:unnamed protein product [Sphacelaria rigidula]